MKIYLWIINFSSKSEMPKRENRYAWDRIGRDGRIKQSIQTREFLGKN